MCAAGLPSETHRIPGKRQAACDGDLLCSGAARNGQAERGESVSPARLRQDLASIFNSGHSFVLLRHVREVLTTTVYPTLLHE